MKPYVRKYNNLKELPPNISHPVTKWWYALPEFTRDCYKIVAGMHTKIVTLVDLCNMYNHFVGHETVHT